MAGAKQVDAVITILEAAEEDDSATLVGVATSIVRKLDEIRKKTLDEERKLAVQELHDQLPQFVTVGVLNAPDGDVRVFVLGPFRSEANARAAGPSFAISPDRRGSGKWRTALWVPNAPMAWESMIVAPEDPVLWIKKQAKEAYPGRWAAEYWDDRNGRG